MGFEKRLDGIYGKWFNQRFIFHIAKHYPTDKATGYGVDELRGIWVVEMEKK